MDEEKFSRYLNDQKNGYVRVTPEIKKLAEEITDGLDNQRDKAEKNYEFVRSKPYFLSPATRSDKLINRKTMDCGAKATFLTSLNRSMGIPSRIALMECPMEGFHKTLEHLELPPMLRMVGKSALDMAGKNAMGGTHYAVESYYDDDWHFMDPTMNDKFCDYFDGEKKEACQSKENVSAVLGCRKIGHSEDLPSNGIILSSLARLASDVSGATEKITNGKEKSIVPSNFDLEKILFDFF